MRDKQPKDQQLYTRVDQDTLDRVLARCAVMADNTTTPRWLERAILEKLERDEK